MFDTGCHPAVADDPVAHWGPFAEHLQVSYPKEMLLDRQIQALGYKMSDIKYVLISHLHLDHTGYMHAFPNATFIIMQDELRYAYWPEPHLRDVFVFKDIVPTRGFQWLELSGDFDIFGDGSLHMLKTPGHTPGESSLHVRLPNRSILLVGDTIHLREQFNTLSGMPLDTDPRGLVVVYPTPAGPFGTCTSVRSGSRTTRKTGMSCPTRQPPLSKEDGQHATLRIPLPAV